MDPITLYVLEKEAMSMRGVADAARKGGRFIADDAAASFKRDRTLRQKGKTLARKASKGYSRGMADAKRGVGRAMDDAKASFRKTFRPTRTDKAVKYLQNDFKETKRRAGAAKDYMKKDLKQTGEDFSKAIPQGIKKRYNRKFNPTKLERMRDYIG